MIIKLNCFPLVVIREYGTGCGHIRKHNLPRIHVVHDGLNEGRGNKVLSLCRDRHLQGVIVGQYRTWDSPEMPMRQKKKN